MARFPHPWFVCGGWAIDLFVGEVTREHEDIELDILRADQASVRTHFAGRELYKSISGGWVSWGEGERLDLPIHQVLVRPLDAGPLDEPWEPVRGEIQFFLNDAEGGVWLCRRDERVTRPLREVSVRAASGIPIVAPEIQLLYKAKQLAIVHPGDAWLDALRPS